MELSDGEPRVRAGLYGNLGALLMGAAGRLEEALEFTEMSIEAGKETSIPDTSLTAGMHSSLILRTVLLRRCSAHVCGQPALPCTTQFA